MATELTEISKFIEGKIAAMTLEEKVAQMTCASGKEFVNPNTGEWIGDEIARERLKYGLGQITRLGGITKLAPERIADLNNRIQKILTEETNIKIPVINREECLAGYMISGAAVFPQMISAASTWNPDLIQKMTDIIRKEMRAVGATHAMSPNLDVVRDPRWGRCEETFGEDPYLVSKFGCSYIDGLQSKDLTQGVASCGKHFLAHGLPEGGTNWSPVLIGNRELREIFGRPFEAAAQKSNMASIMAAYHEIDGIPLHSSEEILKELYKKEMSGKGIVISDAMGIQTLNSYHNIAKDNVEAAALACNAGIDIELPFAFCYREPLIQAVNQGLVAESTINERVRGILQLKQKLGLFENPYVDVENVENVYGGKEAQSVSNQIAQESIVLLKNSKNILPLPKTIKKIAVIGPTGNNPRLLLGDYSFPTHVTEINNFGKDKKEDSKAEDENLLSNYVVNYAAAIPWSAPTIFEAIRDHNPSSSVSFTQGCDYLSEDKSGFKEAIKVAKKATVIVLTLGGKSGMSVESTSGEMRDRASIKLPGIQEELVLELAKLGKPMVGILINGRPYGLQNVIDKFHALIEGWLPGDYGGEAIANVLFGDYNPGGKLTMTFPRTVGQIPMYYNHKPSGMHSQFFGDYVDLPISPMFPFGHGLSCTTFQYDGFELKTAGTTDSEIELSCYVKNTGDRPGDTVTQLYMRDLVASVTRPILELKGFYRVSLGPKEVKRIIFTLPAGLLGFFNKQMKYVVEPGDFELSIGESSRKLISTKKITLSGDAAHITRQPFFSSAVCESIGEIPEDLFSTKKQSLNLNIKSTMKELISHPESKAFLRSLVGDMVDSKQLKMTYRLTLIDIQKYAPKMLTDEKLKEIDEGLRKL